MGHEIVTVFGKSIQSKKKRILKYYYTVYKIIPRKTMDYNEIVTIFGNYQLLKKKNRS